VDASGGRVRSYTHTHRHTHTLTHTLTHTHHTRPTHQTPHHTTPQAHTHTHSVYLSPQLSHSYTYLDCINVPSSRSSYDRGFTRFPLDTSGCSLTPGGSVTLNRTLMLRYFVFSHSLSLSLSLSSLCVTMQITFTHTLRTTNPTISLFFLLRETCSGVWFGV
jgi:hypothetical protein